MVTLSLRLEETFTASSMFLYVHEDHKYYVGRGAQDGHPDFHTAPELCRLHLSFFHNATETAWLIRDGEKEEGIGYL